MSWGDPTTKVDYLTRAILSPLSVAFGFASYIRLRMYSEGLIERDKVSVPVLSVGNLTVGGTGKTPLTIFLAGKLAQSGLKVAVLSRGYGRESKQHLVIAGDGAGNFASDTEAGDEPVLIAKRVPQAIVLVCSSRVFSAKYAIEKMGAQAIILDDGFQHLQLCRDLDFVLVPYRDDLETDMLLPAGRLREPVSALTRATNIVISKVPEHFDKNRLEELEKYLQNKVPLAHISAFKLSRSGIVDSNFQPLDKDHLRGKRVIAFSALARNDDFLKTVEQSGANILASKSFPDHLNYKVSDKATLLSLLANYQAEILVTSEKDLVKLHAKDDFSNKLCAIQVDVDWLGVAPPVNILSGISSAKP